MVACVAVKTGGVFVDCQCRDSTMLGEQFECRVDGGLRQGGHRAYEVVLYHIDGRMVIMSEHIFHYRYPLCGRLDGMCCQTLDGFGSHLLVI